MSSRHNARKAAVQALYQWDLTAQAADQIERQFSQIHDMQNIDKKYLREILHEVPKREVEIQNAIAVHLDREFKKLDPVERAILRIGAYELLCRPDVPTRVVMNEMIELAKVFGSDHSYKFINGVMDKMAKALRPPTKGTAAKGSVKKVPVKKASETKAPVTKAPGAKPLGIKPGSKTAPAGKRRDGNRPVKAARTKSSDG